LVLKLWIVKNLIKDLFMKVLNNCCATVFVALLGGCVSMPNNQVGEGVSRDNVAVPDSKSQPGDAGVATESLNSAGVNKKEFMAISSLAAIQTADNVNELSVYIDKFNANGSFEDFGGGKEYLKLDSENYTGCWFPNENSSFKSRLAKGAGLLSPVYRNPTTELNKSADGLDSMVDWVATEKIHKLLTGNAKLKLLPISASKDYWNRMKVYIEKQYQDDSNRYLDISNAGGGIFGQLIGGATDKNNSFSKTKDPNYRLSGFVRPDYYKEVLEKFGDIAYVINSNEAAAISMYYKLVQSNVLARQDNERLALNLQKDVSGIMHEALLGSKYYYYGMIDNERASKSSMVSILASSILRININSNLDGKRLLENEIKLMRLLSDADEYMFMLRGNHGADLSFSLIDKYKTMSRNGLDNDRVFCGAYDKKISVALVEISGELQRLKLDRSVMLNPIVFNVKVGMPGYEKERQEFNDKVIAVMENIVNIRNLISQKRIASERLLVNKTIPLAFKSSGYTGFIASNKLR